MNHSSAVPIDLRAQDTLRYIRASMDAASLLAVPGSAGIAIGVVGLGALLLASNPNLRPHMLGVWLWAAAIAIALGGALVARQWSLQGSAWLAAPARKFLICFAPPLLAGAIMTRVLFVDGDLHAMPGTWLLLYGCAVLAASSTTARFLALLGALFMLLGLAAFALPSSLHNALLGAGFGGLHFVFGAYLMVRGRHAGEA